MSKRKYELNFDYFENIDTPEKAYLLGFIYADGSVSKNLYYLTIELAEKDIEILDFIAKQIFINNKPEYTLTVKNKKNYLKLSISSKALVSRLVNLGCTPNKTFTLEFPDLLEEFVPHFIRGYFDGDGTVTSRYTKSMLPCVSIVSTLNFLNELQNFLLKKNIISSKKTIIKETNSEIRKFQISSMQDVYNFYYFLYDNETFSLKRKKEKYTFFISNILKNNRFGKTKYSKYKFITFDKSRNKWSVCFKQKHLGRFLTEEEAYVYLQEYIKCQQLKEN